MFVLWWCGVCCEWVIELGTAHKGESLPCCVCIGKCEQAVWVSDVFQGGKDLEERGYGLCWCCGRCIDDCSQSSFTWSNESVLACVCECSPVRIRTVLQVWLDDRQIVLPSCCLCEWISSTTQSANLFRDFWNQTVHMCFPWQCTIDDDSQILIFVVNG